MKEKLASDCERFSKLCAELKIGQPNWSEIWREIEEIKNRYGGMPPMSFKEKLQMPRKH